MMNNKILLIGGGGHCKSVLDTVLENNTYTGIGIIDKAYNIGNTVMGIPIIGDDTLLSEFLNKGYRYAFVTIGTNINLRVKLLNYLEKMGYIIPNIFDKSSEISKHSIIDNGVFIGKGAIINAEVSIKKGAIINSGAIIEHDCKIGEFVHIAPGSVLSGEVIIGDYSQIGANTTIKQQVKIGANVVVGMGSVVTKNIPDGILAYGIPCKEVRKL